MQQVINYFDGFLESHLVPRKAEGDNGDDHVLATQSRFFHVVYQVPALLFIIFLFML